MSPIPGNPSILGKLGRMIILTVALSLSLAHTSTPPPEEPGRSVEAGANLVLLQVVVEVKEASASAGGRPCVGFNNGED